MTHTSTEQPEALRLASIIETPSLPDTFLRNRVAAELRRQHARIVELEAELAAAPQAVQAVVSVAHRHEFTDGHRTLKQDVFSAIHDYAATKPEQDPDDQESWESWFEAAFDLLGTRVGQIFEEHAERSAPAHPAEGAPAALLQLADLLESGRHLIAVERKEAANVLRLAATQPAAQGMDAGKLLAEKHTGMKVDYRGLLGQVQREIERSAPGHAEMLRQLQGHLQELGQRWYAGDTAVVDELLQLYCVERQARAALAAQAKQGGAA